MRKYLFLNKVVFVGVMVSLLLHAFGAKMMRGLLQAGIDRIPHCLYFQSRV